MNTWNHYKTAAVVLAVWLATLAAYGLYSGNTASQLDETRPPDTGEPAAYGAAAIREVKRVFKNWLSVEHYLDGKHRTNFFKPYMAGSNSISGASLISNSVPQWALQPQVTSNAIYYVTRVASQALVSASGGGVKNLLTGGGSLTISASSNRFLIVDARIMCWNSGSEDVKYTNTLRCISGTSTQSSAHVVQLDKTQRAIVPATAVFDLIPGVAANVQFLWQCSATTASLSGQLVHATITTVQ